EPYTPGAPAWSGVPVNAPIHESKTRPEWSPRKTGFPLILRSFGGHKPQKAPPVVRRQGIRVRGSLGDTIKTAARIQEGDNVRLVGIQDVQFVLCQHDTKIRYHHDGAVLCSQQKQICS